MAINDAENLENGTGVPVIQVDASTTQPAPGSTPVMDHNYPLYLHSTDVSGISLISLQLTGAENYSLWSKYMRIALLGRNKLGFVDGSWKKENFREELWYQWERCNAIVQSWIINTVSSNLLGGIVYAGSAQDVWEDLKERFNKVDGSRSFSLHQVIVRLTQGTASVATYFTKLKELWVELEALARSQILLMIPLPSVNQAYAMVVSDEAQKAMGAASNSVGLLVTMPNLDPIAMYSKIEY
ncbi:PREDICTED: uncharacterized protein LOC109212484 [Nicotiana attenuata]|uniref:uncharacterized protein LOC109212484 n=1 Tax=Nicotiana attenuata TaxID=49451 RepID=UPI0009046D73|nr:PREDICTED: uncharacterized protein LOC109212484 [Nicotiana attenuata]